MFQMGCKNLIYFSQVVKGTATLQCYGLLALVIHQRSIEKDLGMSQVLFCFCTYMNNP